jgi:hypothetical protein
VTTRRCHGHRDGARRAAGSRVGRLRCPAAAVPGAAADRDLPRLLPHLARDPTVPDRAALVRTGPRPGPGPGARPRTGLGRTAPDLDHRHSRERHRDSRERHRDSRKGPARGPSAQVFPTRTGPDRTRDPAAPAAPGRTAHPDRTGPLPAHTDTRQVHRDLRPAVPGRSARRNSGPARTGLDRIALVRIVPPRTTLGQADQGKAGPTRTERGRGRIDPLQGDQGRTGQHLAVLSRTDLDLAVPGHIDLGLGGQDRTAPGPADQVRSDSGLAGPDHAVPGRDRTVVRRVRKVGLAQLRPAHTRRLAGRIGQRAALAPGQRGPARLTGGRRTLLGAVHAGESGGLPGEPPFRSGQKRRPRHSGGRDWRLGTAGGRSPGAGGDGRRRAWRPPGAPTGG